jgi:hypothetical protein
MMEQRDNQLINICNYMLDAAWKGAQDGKNRSVKISIRDAKMNSSTTRIATTKRNRNTDVPCVVNALDVQHHGVGTLEDFPADVAGEPPVGVDGVAVPTQPRADTHPVARWRGAADATAPARARFGAVLVLQKTNNNNGIKDQSRDGQPNAQEHTKLNSLLKGKLHSARASRREHPTNS